MIAEYEQKIVRYELNADFLADEAVPFRGAVLRLTNFSQSWETIEVWLFRN